MSGTLLSFGHGYVSAALATVLLARGWRVIGTTRDPARAEALAAGGIEALVWPGSDIGPALASASHVLSSVPPGPGGDPVATALDGMLPRAGAGLRWAGYLSTTGVYGDRDGGWVNEDTPPRPTTARGQARLSAERAWQRLAATQGLALHIFRLAAIYGPGRSPFARLRAGSARRIVKPGQVFSRIHVDDIVATLAASMAAPAPGMVLNLADDLPAPPDEVLAHAARLAGLPEVPAIAYDPARLEPGVASFYAENKRVSNARLKAFLGRPLSHPDYRAGLAAILAAETAATRR